MLHGMSRFADKLAYALSRTATLTRQKYKSLFDHLYASDATAAGYDLDEIADWRRNTASLLESLGVCDFFYDQDRVAVCPPALTLLPWAGLPAAHLTGARTRTIVQQLRAAVKEARGAIDLTVAAQYAFPLLPNRIVVLAESMDALRTCAAAVGLSVHGPTARELLGRALTLDAYLAAQRREPAMELAGWTREDFDPDAVQWRSPFDATPRLSMYQHPQKRGREFFLYDGAEMLRVHPAWGRYAVLARTGRSVLRYDAEEGVLLVPAGARLPSIFERGLTLLSGFAAQPTVHDGTFSVAYIRVSQPDAETVATKLRQKLLITTRPASIRGTYD
jgi:hypothetical protein